MTKLYQGVRFARSLPLVTATAIREAEEQLGVALPDDYRAFLKAVNGGVPAPSEFAMEEPGQRACIDFLYGVGTPRGQRDLRYQQKRIVEQTDSLPEGFVALGFDPGAAPYFVGTRGKTAGKIYFYDPDGFLDPGRSPKLYIAAANFSDLLARLAAG